MLATMESRVGEFPKRFLSTARRPVVPFCLRRDRDERIPDQDWRRPAKPNRFWVGIVMIIAVILVAGLSGVVLGM